MQLEYDFEPITRQRWQSCSPRISSWQACLAVGFLYLWLYTSSLALALSGVLQLAFAAVRLFYRYIFWLQHVENLTLLAAPLTAAFSLDAMALRRRLAFVDRPAGETRKSICFPCTWSALPAAPLPPAAGARSLAAARAARLGDPRRRHRRFPFGGGRRRCLCRFRPVTAAQRGAPWVVLCDTAHSAAVARALSATCVSRTLP